MVHELVDYRATRSKLNARDGQTWKVDIYGNDSIYFVNRKGLYAQCDTQRAMREEKA
jgi:hypothetical protein